MVATQAAEIELSQEQQDALTALLEDNETLVEGMCKELPVFAKRAFGDSNDQFQAWIEDVNKNSGTAPSTNISTTPSTPTIAPVEKPKKKITPSFGVQPLQSGIAQIAEQARSSAAPDIAHSADNRRSSAAPDIAHSADNRHSSAVPDGAPSAAQPTELPSLFGPSTEPAAALPKEATATAPSFPFPPRVAFTPVNPTDPEHDAAMDMALDSIDSAEQDPDADYDPDAIY